MCVKFVYLRVKRKGKKALEVITHVKYFSKYIATYFRMIYVTFLLRLRVMSDVWV